MKFKIRLACHIIEIEHRYNFIYSQCRYHLAKEDEKAEIFVSSTDESIERERGMLSSRALRSPEYLEANAIHREILQKLLYLEILSIHSAVVAYKGNAYAFIARSGTGKSTHAMQWLKCFDGAFILNGDKPLYAYSDGVLTVYDSPWRGKEGCGVNTSMPVKAFCIIERADDNQICKVSAREAVIKMFEQTLRPESGEETEIHMRMLDSIITNTPFFRLKCNISEDAARLAYNAMSENT